MSEKFILLVSDEMGSKQAEITVVESAKEAEHLMETLLEAGFDEGRIKIFRGEEAALGITYRPVVTLSDAASGEPQADRAADEGDATATKIPSVFRREFDDASDETEPALSSDGRFSSLFRSARDDTFALSACEEAA